MSLTYLIFGRLSTVPSHPARFVADEGDKNPCECGKADCSTGRSQHTSLKRSFGGLASCAKADGLDGISRVDWASASSRFSVYGAGI
jgi:hypothetical protein